MNYLQWLTSQTPTKFWHDSAIPAIQWLSADPVLWGSMHRSCSKAAVRM